MAFNPKLFSEIDLESFLYICILNHYDFKHQTIFLYPSSIFFDSGAKLKHFTAYDRAHAKK